MNWTEVAVKTTTEAVEAISNILLEERCGGVMIEDPKDFLFQKKNELDWDYVEEEVFNKSNQDGVLIKTYIPEERNVLELVETIKAKISLLPDCGLDIGEGSVSLSNVNESDWANEWKKYYKPTKIGLLFQHLLFFLYQLYHLLFHIYQVLFSPYNLFDYIYLIFFVSLHCWLKL